MTCIVADSGPLIMLGRSGLLGHLRQIAGTILVPATVFAECTHDANKPGASVLILALASELIHVEPSPAPPLSTAAHLDAGEIEALTIAHNRGCPVLIDEYLGRKVAGQLSIKVLGSAGILLIAKERQLISEVAPILRDWKSWGYFLSPSLLESVLSRAGESQSLGD